MCDEELMDGNAGTRLSPVAAALGGEAPAVLREHVAVAEPCDLDGSHQHLGNIVQQADALDLAVSLFDCIEPGGPDGIPS